MICWKLKNFVIFIKIVSSIIKNKEFSDASYELFPINGCPAEGAQMDNVLKKIGKKNAVRRIIPKDLGLVDIMYIMDTRGKLRANEMGGWTPKGKQLVYAVMSCYPNPELDIQPHLDYIESIVRKIQPDLFDHIYRTELMTPMQSAAAGTDKMGLTFGGEAYGVANSIGQSGDQRPSPISPIRNLYYVGNDAGGFGMGTNQAVDSAVTAVNMILEQ